MKEKDILHKLTDDDIEIPESIQPENIRKQLLAMEPEKKKPRWQKITMAGTAVAAGAAICILAALQLPLIDKQGDYSTEPVKIAQGEPGKELPAEKKDYTQVYDSLSKLDQKFREIEEKSKQDKMTIFEENALQTDGASANLYENASEAKGVANSATNSETNVRTQGVDEGDIVKTDGKYIYSYSYTEGKDGYFYQLYIYQVDGKKTKKIATVSFDKEGLNQDYVLEDMYLSGGKLVLVTSLRKSMSKNQIKTLYQRMGGDYHNFCEESWNVPSEGRFGLIKGVDMSETGSDDVAYINPVVYTLTSIYNISDPSKPTLEKEFFQDGSYESSRVVEDKLYLISKRDINTSKMKKEHAKTFVPQIGGECVPPDKVDVASQNEERRYQVLSSIDISHCEYVDKKAVLGGGGNIYVSHHAIYLIDQLTWDDRETILLKYSYKDGQMKKEAEGKLKGYLKDDYAIDEKDGYLRAVTTYYGKKGNEKNAVFVFDDNLKQLGKITDIAENENVYAVRFMGDLVYFVTYEQTDPVFVADLSNPKEPKIVGELKLPGFSTYMHPFGENLMVGIGKIDDEGESKLKISLFDISNPKRIKEIHKLLLGGKNGTYFGGSEVLYNPNALFVDEERQMIGFSVGDHSVKQSYYVYQIDKEKGIIKQCEAKMKDNDSYGAMASSVRGLYIGDYFYIVKPGKEVQVYSYPQFKKVD